MNESHELSCAKLGRLGEHSPLMNFDIVGYVAIGSTLIALLVVRLLKKLSEEKMKSALKVSTVS